MVFLVPDWSSAQEFSIDEVEMQPYTTGTPAFWGRRPSRMLSWNYGRLLVEDTVDVLRSVTRGFTKTRTM